MSCPVLLKSIRSLERRARKGKGSRWEDAEGLAEMAHMAALAGDCKKAKRIFRHAKRLVQKP